MPGVVPMELRQGARLSQHFRKPIAGFERGRYRLPLQVGELIWRLLEQSEVAADDAQWRAQLV